MGNTKDTKSYISNSSLVTFVSSLCSLCYKHLLRQTLLKIGMTGLLLPLAIFRPANCEPINDAFKIVLSGILMIYNHLKLGTSLTIIVSSLFLLSFSCTTKAKKSKYYLNIKEGIDTSIILVNIGHLNRSELGDLILRIDSCHPNSITINAIFRKLNDPAQDSVLISSLQRISGDLLTFYFDSLSQPVRSNKEFAKHVDIQGLNDPIVSNGLITHFKPISEVNGKIYPALALEIVKKRIPGFQPNYKVNKSFPIEYSKLASSIIVLEPHELHDQYICSAIKNKIILMGYLGPGEEDKFFTPLRYVMENSEDKPDTYGTVILANQILTIMNQRQITSD